MQKAVNDYLVLVREQVTAQSIDESLGDHLHRIDLAIWTKQTGGRV